MACCESFSKVLLIIFNTIFFIIGGVILGVGIWVKVDKSNLFEIMRKVHLGDTAQTISATNNSILDIIAIVLIVLGAFTFVSGFCGCCGAIRESPCLLYTYCALVAVIIIAEIGIGIYAGVEQKKFTENLSNELLKLVKQDFNGVINNNNASFFTKLLTSVMFEVKCCGINGRNDFEGTEKNWRANVNGVVQTHPVGCCLMKWDVKFDASKTFDYSSYIPAMKTTNCPFQPTPDLNTNGCVTTIIDLLRKNLAAVIGVCVGLGLFEILCIVFACCVARKDDGGYA